MINFVQQSVKVSRLCQGCNGYRCEECVSQIAICHNIVHNVDDETKEKIKEIKEEKGEYYKSGDKLKAREVRPKMKL